MDIYENVIIGNFLFGLGAAFGAKSNINVSPPISVNLLQQTPLDKTSGDVLIQGARSMRLIEFKRSVNDDAKEKSKLHALEASLNNTLHSHLKPISRKVHWFIETCNSNLGLQVSIRPYLDLEKTEPNSPSLKKFISEFVEEAFGVGESNENIFKKYLSLITLIQSGENSSSGGSGGLIVTVDKSGTIHYAVVEDLQDLALELKKYHEIYVRRQRELINQRNLEINQKQEKILDGHQLGGLSL